MAVTIKTFITVPSAARPLLRLMVNRQLGFSNPFSHHRSRLAVPGTLDPSTASDTLLTVSKRQPCLVVAGPGHVAYEGYRAKQCCL